jgi:hypothetical protein
MSTVTFDSPVLVSEVPASTIPAPPARPGLLARCRDEIAQRRQSRAFERAVRRAGASEQSDLLAARRRD